MIGVGLLRGVFLGGIMMWYTLSVWKTVDQYFRDQFQEYLTKEYEENSAMKQDVLVEKEKLATRKMLLDKLKRMEAREKVGLPPGIDTTTEENGAKIGEQIKIPGAEVDSVGEEWAGYQEHGVYSAEEVYSGQGPGEMEESASSVLDSFQVIGEDFTSEEDAGVEECLVEDCSGQEDQVSTKWRNVFDEDGEVCRFDNHLSAESSCSQPEEAWEVSEVFDENN